MDDVFTRLWADLAGRLTGPMTFRLILQPVMAMLYAFRDGVKDAREGRPAYFWTIFNDPDQRHSLIREGGKAVGRVILLGVVMDAIYQLIVAKWIYPLELIVVVFVLAFLPYMLLRGPINRLARLWLHPGKVPTR